MSKGRESKPHIGIFGLRNRGKSSIINALSGQQIAIVSETPGTTTDPVKKTVEVKGIGPTIFVDTAGIDDAGELGHQRVYRTQEVLEMVDVAVLVLADNELTKEDEMLIARFIDLEIPYILVHNKSDLRMPDLAFQKQISTKYAKKIIEFSALQDTHRDKLLLEIVNIMPPSVYMKKSILGDILNYGDIVLLITPIDIEAPEGRMILPQVQAIRDILDNDCVAIILKEKEIDAFLRSTQIKPKLAITDSQVFLKVDASVPKDIPLTSFSIMLARHKGDFYNYIKGTPKISELKDGDTILLLESCTHQVSCDDIGRVKIPRWISNFSGKKLHFEVVAGLDKLPKAITEYALVIQCGGCMVTHKQLMNRLKKATSNNVPITNYGMAIAYVQGIFDRAISPFIGTEKSTDYL